MILCALLENSAVTGMVDVSVRLIHRAWPVITTRDAFQIDKMEILGTLLSSLSLPPHLFPFS